MPRRIEGNDEFNPLILAPSKGERDYDNTVYDTFQSFADRTIWLKNRYEELEDLIGSSISASSVIVGSGDPDPDLGKDSDLYIDEDTGNFWYKSGGVWTLVIDSSQVGSLSTINQVEPVDKNIDLEAGPGIEIVPNPGSGSVLVQLYTDPIASLTNNIGTVEIGNTVSSVTLNWTFNKEETSQSLNQGIGSRPIGERSFVHAPVNYTSDVTYTLTISDGTNTITNNSAIKFLNRVHWGTSANTSLTSPQILGLSNNSFATGRSRSFTIDGNGEYLYYCYPESFGEATFTVNGLLNTAWTQTIVSHTNASGFTTNYRVYRSNFIQNGTGINVEVS